MNGHYFVSYSRVDGAQFARRLYDQLVGGRPSYPVWLDTLDAQRGADWDAQIAEAIQTCRGLLFVMTPDSVQEHSVPKSEWVWALRCKKPVIPLRADTGVEPPFRLSSREYVDFSNGFEIGLARLRSYLDSLGSPRWLLQELRAQLSEAERELPRAGPERRPRIEQDIADLRKRVADQQGLVADPEGAARRTEERITAALDVQRQAEQSAAGPALARFVNSPPMVAPSYFQDRMEREPESGKQGSAEGQKRPDTPAGRGMFVSYSHRDERYRQRLEIALSQLQRSKLISIWHDRKILPGEDWDREIDKNLEGAGIILLLISPDFLASDYAYAREMERALQRHQSGSAKAVPIILRPCDWQSSPFGKLQALPSHGRPVSNWSNRDQAWLDVAQGLRRLISNQELSIYTLTSAR